MGSSREESNNTSETVVAAPTVVDAFPIGMDSGPDVMLGSFSPEVCGPVSGSPVDAVADLPKCLPGRVGCRPPGLVPRWRLAGRAPSLRSVHLHQSVVWVLDARFVTQPTALRTMRRHLHLHSLSRDQAMDAAIQLHRDVCLMATNLDVLDQYVLSLQGTASKILKLGWIHVVFRRRRWLRVPWDPGSSVLLSRWRLLVCSDPHWTRLRCHRTYAKGQLFLKLTLI